tara:strand:+ start:919 stop:1839 length:921 start_codon:yes stop_codon:yes gene_type:complete
MSNKRGIIFTASVIAIISLFALSYTFFNQVSERVTIQKRIESMNSFLFSVEEDIERRLFIFGFRYIFIAENEISLSGSPISNLNNSFQEAFYNGTFQSASQDILVGTTFSELQEKINEKANKINVNLSLSNPTIEISQTDPWNVKISLLSNLFMNDSSGLAYWNKTSLIESYIPITNFEDPLYYVSTSGLVSNNITRSPYAAFVSGSDISNLSSHSDNSYYISSTTAPSFLKRLQGVNTASEFGVESLVNLQELSSQGISIQDKSVVDYIYFSGSDPTSCSASPLGMPSWFKLDSPHLSVYEVSCS